MARFRLTLLGGAAIDGPDGPLDGPITQPNRMALLAVLGCTRDGGLCTRERLVSLLWPESDPGHASHALSNVLYHVRSALGNDALIRQAGAVGLDAGHVQVDVAVFEQAVSREDDATAITAYGGPLLAGVNLRRSAEFEHWLDVERDRLRRLHARVLDRRADELRRGGRMNEALDLLRIRADAAPLSTPAALRLMEALAEAGETAAAVLHGTQHLGVLEAELSMSAPAALSALLGRLKEHPAAGAATRSQDPSARAPAAANLTTRAPFVGRESELADLLDRLERAAAGSGQVMLISGEAGTGKSALAEALCWQALARHSDLLISFGRGNAYTGRGDSFHPFRQVLSALTADPDLAGAPGSIMHGQVGRARSRLDRVGETLARTGPDLIGTLIRPGPLLGRFRDAGCTGPWYDEIARHNGPSSDGDGPPLQPDLFRQYTAFLRELADTDPMLLVLDDLQWADSGSIRLLFHLLREAPTCRILVLGLYRSSEITGAAGDPRHPLDSVLNEAVRRFGDIRIHLDETGGRPFVDALVDLEPNRLDEAFRGALHRRTGGHALFTVELLRQLKETGRLVRDSSGLWAASEDIEWSGLPARVEAVVAERMARLPGHLRSALEAASVQGKGFVAQAVARTLGVDAGELLLALDHDAIRRYRVVAANGARATAGGRLAGYRFRHDLFQEYLYRGLDRGRREALHRETGLALESLLGDEVEVHAVQLARHFEEAGMPSRSARYLRRAGEDAMRAGANGEAAAHYGKAVAALDWLPPSTARDRAELDAHLGLGYALLWAARPGQESALERGVELAEKLDDAPALFWSLAGLYYSVGHMGGDNREGMALARRCLAIARDQRDPRLLVHALEFMGRNAYNRGDFGAMSRHYEELLDTFLPERDGPERLTGFDLAAVATAQLGQASWQLGSPDRAVDLTAAALARCKRPEAGRTLPMVLYMDVLVHTFRRDPARAAASLTALDQAATETGQEYWAPYLAIGNGWCAAQTGALDEGVTEMRRGWELARTMGFRVWFAYFTALLAEALGRQGRAEEGLVLLDQAHEAALMLEERCQDTEIHRTRGTLCLALPDPDPEAAEASFRRALAVAEQQQARSYGLRAATSLARLLLAQDRSGDALEILSPLHAGFIEGLDTVDLQEADAAIVAARRAVPTRSRP